MLQTSVAVQQDNKLCLCLISHALNFKYYSILYTIVYSLQTMLLPIAEILYEHYRYDASDYKYTIIVYIGNSTVLLICKSQHGLQYTNIVYMVITHFTVESGINSTCNALNDIWLYIILFRALLVLLISNATVNCAVSYTKKLSTVAVNCHLVLQLLH